MSEYEVAWQIMLAMDEEGEREYRWNTNQLGKLQANILLLQNNGVQFTPALITSIARGEKLPEGLHWHHMDEVLDEIYDSLQS